MNWYEYRCNCCGKTVARMQDGEPKQWIKSYCEAAGKIVHIVLVNDQSEK